ncbi:MAG: DNA-binding protein [Clostridia bacterium]|nr:YlxM family DNA-binding protein [Oscillospiraceae bacterium]MBS5432188.1 YlxM family DNA-binding protein [Bacillota bacterium]PWM15279.1 MAG: DNA-binding protein [Clostridia bacterium]
MQSMLLDFYGELLTEKQRECFDLHYNEDLSLSEIAEQSGISRQGVWDNIRRAEAALRDTEAKTGLIRRFSETREGLERLRGQLESLCSMTEGSARETAAAALSQVEALIAGGSDRG